MPGRVDGPVAGGAAHRCAAPPAVDGQAQGSTVGGFSLAFGV